MAGITYEEFIKMANDKYFEGGDVFCECWEKYQFEEYCRLFGPITRRRALKMFEEERRSGCQL